MSDDVKALAAVAREILDRARGQIGTHWNDCHKYHLACFAAFAIDALEAAQQAPAVDRDALAQALWQGGNKGLPNDWWEEATGIAKAPYYAKADHVLASGILQDAFMGHVSRNGFESDTYGGMADAVTKGDRE